MELVVIELVEPDDAPISQVLTDKNSVFFGITLKGITPAGKLDVKSVFARIVDSAVAAQSVTAFFDQSTEIPIKTFILGHAIPTLGLNGFHSIIA
jgi:hypothetical protein